MKLTIVDVIIIFVYLLSTIVIGLVLRKVAQKNKSNYMLGGNKLPWYMLEFRMPLECLTFQEPCGW